MKYEIKNRFTDAVQIVADIACDENATTRAKLGLAVRWAFKVGADLGGADLRGADLRNANLGGADLGGAYLRNADLGGAYLRNADLGGADLGGADLGGADLRGAYLRNADLRGAYLRNADLGGADLGGADLRNADLGEQWIVQGPTRSDGYFFMLTSFKDEGVRVKAGCRNFSLEQARQHWQATRAGMPLGAETFAILDCMEAMAMARGLLPCAK